MQAVILAAGRGTRLLPITQMRTKAMLPVLGKPMIARIITALAFCGVREFILVTSPTDQEMSTYFLSSPIPGVEIQFVEQFEPRGMAHALICAEPWINGDFILSACDSLLSLEDYALLISAWNCEPKLAALLALLPINPEKASQTGIVQIENGLITRIIEKPAPDQVFSNIASLPIYLFEQRIFSHLSRLKPSKRGELELQDAIQMLIDSYGRVRGELVSSRMNLTSAQDLLEINLYFLQKEAPQKIQDPVQIGRNVTLIPPYFLGANTIIGDQCVIGPQVYVESNAHIGQGCSISNTILLQGSRLDLPQVIKNTIIFPEQSTHQNQGSTQ